MQDLIKTLSTVARTFESRYFQRPVDYAQDQLMGRTHYVDPDTLRYFYARILAARPLVDGAFFMITESSAKDPHNNERGFRCVVFDVFGEVVFRRSIDEMLSTSTAAEKDMLAWLAELDPVAYYAKAIDDRAKIKGRELDRLSAAAAALSVDQLMSA